MVAQQHWVELWHQKVTREHYLYLQPHRHENANTSESWAKFGKWKLKGTAYHSQWYSITPPELGFMRGCTTLSHNSKFTHDTWSSIKTWYCTVLFLYNNFMLVIPKQTPEHLSCFSECRQSCTLWKFYTSRCCTALFLQRTNWKTNENEKNYLLL